jgi:hypothetical protein
LYKPFMSHIGRDIHEEKNLSVKRQQKITLKVRF